MSGPAGEGWNRRVWQLAGPIILSNITVPLLGAVDTAVVGHLPDPRFIGGVAIGALVFSFVYWGFGFLRMGTTGPTAQAWGGGDGAELRAILARGLLLAGILAAVLLLLQAPIGAVAFTLLHGSAAVEGEAQVYYAIRIWGAPAALANYVLLGWFLGLQNARWPLALQVFANGLNIVLDLLFVLLLGWGVAGVAAATVIAEYSALGLGLVLALHRLRRLSGALAGRQVFDGGRIRRMLAVNRDIFVRTLLLILSFAWFTDRSASLGDVTLAANAVLMHLVTIAAYGLDGFAHAAEALVGDTVGRGDRDGLAGAVRAGLRWSVVIAAAFSMAYIAAGGTIIDLLTNLPEVRAAAREFLPWACLAPVVGVWCYLYDGIFLGATRTEELRNAMIVSATGYVLLVAVLMREFENHGLWAALLSFFVLRALALAAYYPRLLRGVRAQR